MQKTLIGLSWLMALAGTAHAETAAPEGYQLQQVLIFSRHNLRAPLANTGSVLEQSTPHSWPQWDVPGGQLTTKGGVLEVYMGHYMREWLAQQGLIKADECPPADTVYAYANSLQRTVATAQFFINGAFPGCDVPVHHQAKMGTMDPVFNPVITNGSPQFKQQALAAMTTRRAQDHLDDSYALLAEITDYQNSPACKVSQQCDLAAGQDRFTVQPGEEPGVSGPLKIGNSLVDAFTLQYYQGFAPGEVAWGEIESDKQWRTLSALKNSYQDTLFTSGAVARNVAAPLIKYINHVLVTDGSNPPPVTLMVGHDSNIASLLSALDFAPYQLTGQYERTPIGGKIVFQRWHDTRNNREMMKIEYVYQTTAQLRNATPLSLAAPAQRVTLALKGCPVDVQGFCPMETFSQIMAQAVIQR